MAKIIYTIWALFLCFFGFRIFEPYFIKPEEDENGDPLVTGPPVAADFFIFGVYVIITTVSLIPSSYRKPVAPILFLYEVNIIIALIITTAAIL